MTEKQISALQVSLFDTLTKVIPPNQSLVDIVADLLEVSNDSAYRRLRGDTPLTIDEVAKLCNTYQLSFDSICSNNILDSVSFNYKPIESEEDYKSYLRYILLTIKKISQAENKHIIYAAEDIPLFHHFRVPELASFKIYYWLRAVVNDPRYTNERFHRNFVHPEILDICSEIMYYFSKIPSTEIWSDVTPASLFMQVKFFWDSGLFRDKEEALFICSIIHDEINFIEKQAETSRKHDTSDNPVLGEGSFSLYHSDIEIGNNAIFVTIEDTKALYLTHNTMNIMNTANENFCLETERWIKNLIKKSVLLSGVGEKQRYKFFSKIRADLEKMQKFIEAEE